MTGKNKYLIGTKGGYLGSFELPRVYSENSKAMINKLDLEDSAIEFLTTLNK